jgi:hypothetical protein
LGTATVIHNMPAVEIDQSFHGVAPELIDPRKRHGHTDRAATRASDVYAFAVLAWEVSINVTPLLING